jgi:hypothetical protein
LSGPVQALDKQGSAHEGSAEASGEGLGVTGNLQVGTALYNPSYAARPDNTGLALMRYAGHADVDLMGPLLSLPLDVNIFTDRMRSDGGMVMPSELDLIAGVTSTQAAGPGALEEGVRVEQDRPVDKGHFSQTYVDARARYLVSGSRFWPGLRQALRGGDVSGAATLGVFAINPSYAARPDNSGMALLRYAGHVKVSAWEERFAVALDATLFTDRQASWAAPSELDLTPEVIFGLGLCELHLALERDMPVDGKGTSHRSQEFAYGLVSWAF